MSKSIAKFGLNKIVGKRAQEYEAADPLYEHHAETGKRQRRPLPEGLTKEEARLLRKIRKRAHYLDKGISLCGFRVGWTFFLGLIPFAGDLANALLGYNLIIKPCKKRGKIPGVLLTKMQVNTILATGVSLIPLAGDVIMAAFKPNSRNAWLFEEYLIEIIKSRGGANAVVISDENQAQQVIDRANKGSWSARTGRNDAFTVTAGTNSQGTPAPPVPPRQDVVANRV